MKQVMFVAAIVVSVLMLSSVPVFSQGILEQHWKELEAKNKKPEVAVTQPRKEEKKEEKAGTKAMENMSAGFRINAVLPKDNDVDNTVGFTGYVAYQVMEYLRLEVESGWTEIDEDILGNLHVFPLLFNGQITIPTGTKLTPYLTGGLGVLFFNFEESDTLKASSETIDVNTSFASKLGGGFDYQLNKNVSLNVDVGYIFSSTEAELRFSGTPVGNKTDIDADAWQIGGGLRVSF